MIYIIKSAGKKDSGFSRALKNVFIMKTSFVLFITKYMVSIDFTSNKENVKRIHKDLRIIKKEKKIAFPCEIW